MWLADVAESLVDKLSLELGKAAVLTCQVHRKTSSSIGFYEFRET